MNPDTVVSIKPLLAVLASAAVGGARPGHADIHYCVRTQNSAARGGQRNGIVARPLDTHHIQLSIAVPESHEDWLLPQRMIRMDGTYGSHSVAISDVVCRTPGLPWDDR